MNIVNISKEFQQADCGGSYYDSTSMASRIANKVQNMYWTKEEARRNALTDAERKAEDDAYDAWELSMGEDL